MWDWIDPSLAVRAMARVRDYGSAAHLVLLAGARPGGSPMRAAAEEARRAVSRARASGPRSLPQSLDPVPRPRRGAAGRGRRGERTSTVPRGPARVPHAAPRLSRGRVSPSRSRAATCSRAKPSRRVGARLRTRGTLTGSPRPCHGCSIPPTERSRTRGRGTGRGALHVGALGGHPRRPPRTSRPAARAWRRSRGTLRAAGRSAQRGRSASKVVRRLSR